MLHCGHQCPSLCGETCPEDYCQICSNRREARVDLLEMKTYEEIDLNENPIIVLGCGHLFTAETLDGLISMAEVYDQDKFGSFTGLLDISTSFASSVPRCPDCQCPVRQYCTQRYNRLVNRAVLDEMSKRFLVRGKDDLANLEHRITNVEIKLQESQDEILASVHLASDQVAAHVTKALTPAKSQEITHKLKARHAMTKALVTKIRRFNESVADKNQPLRKLYEAMVNAARRKPIDEMMMGLAIDSSVPTVSRDRRVLFGGRIAGLQAECIILTDKLCISQALKSSAAGASIELSQEPLGIEVTTFLKTCRTFIDQCIEENLPKLAVEATLYYARMARPYQSYCRLVEAEVELASENVKTAKELLESAKDLCKQPFQSAKELNTAVEQSLKMLGKEWYEKVTPEELAAIKHAMVSGSQGINTHSGHWYNCENGHPVRLPISSHVCMYKPH